MTQKQPPHDETARRIQSLLDAGRINDAAALCGDEAKHASPKLLLQIGRVRYFQKRYPEAAECFRRVLQARPGEKLARVMLFGALMDGGDTNAMLELADEFRQCPRSPDETFLAFQAYLSVCDWDAAALLQDEALKLAAAGKISDFLLPGLFIELNGLDVDPELTFRLHTLWGEKTHIPEAQQLCRGCPDLPQGRLKIGYLSPDFCMHPVAFFVHHLIAAHDRDRFEVYCYAHIRRNDELTEKLRRLVDHFVDVTDFSDAELARRIHADGIHILVDLGGHTLDSRLPALAWRPAPVQITYLGYPNTTGLSTVDYRISDPYVDCPDGTRYTEKLLTMPESFLCYGVNPAPLRNTASPALSQGRITFGSFNQARKLNPQVVAAWSRILKRVAGARLLLKARGYANDTLRTNVLQAFSRHGIEPERIEIRSFVRSLEEHMQQYNEVDIALDTFPYNGTTTTCDALAMGVPVVTLAGSTHAHRVGYSILNNIGFKETIALSLDEYVDKAVQLASNPDNLSFLRKCLPTLFDHSILRQPERFTRQLEEVYLKAWEEKSSATRKVETAAADKAYEWIFIVGMPRSGSTWTYNVVRKLLEHSGKGTAIGYVGEKEAVDRLLAGDTGPAPRLVKFHSPSPLALDALQAGRAKAIYTQRDLRDVAVSLMQFEDLTCEQLIASRKLESIMADHAKWRRAANTHKLKYKAIMQQQQQAIQAIAEFLGIKISMQEARKIAEACSIKKAKQKTARIQQGEGSVHELSRGRRYDAVTLPQANHIASGKTGRFRDLLDDEQVHALHALAGEWLVNEGYATADEIAISNSQRRSFLAAMPGGVCLWLPDNLDLMTPYVLREQGDWFEEEIKFVRRLLKPGMRVIDIGANYGCYTLTMARHVGEAGAVWAFEPASATAEYLARSIKANAMRNVHLVRAALSDHKGEARLAVGENAELNALVHEATSTRTEAVPLLRLVDCMQEYGWRNIDFVKLDAEGEEVRIVEGGRRFFGEHSPLVMFELKHGDQINEGLIEAFMALGYRPFILVPGLSLLAPFDPAGPVDAFQLNLFCCKDDRAAALEEAGLLCRESPLALAELPVSEAWASYLGRFAYGRRLLPIWRSQDEPPALPRGDDYLGVLNAYALAQEDGSAAARLQALQTAFMQLINILDAHANLPRLLSLVRIAADLGQRAAAVSVLNDIAKHFEQHPRFDPVEPFLTVSTDAADIDPADQLANWVLGQVLAQRERLQSFSSYFTGSTSLPSLQLIAQLGYADAQMQRRLDQIQRRFAAKDAQSNLQECVGA